jgi:chromosome segregation ATPase
MTQKDIMAVAEKTEPNPSDKILAISSELQEQKAFRFKLEQAIAMLEKEKVSLESENQKLLLSKKIDEHAKEELQSRLARKETEEETQNESLRQLEGKFQEADNSLTKERKETQMLQESLKNLDKENASLQFRLQDTTAQLSKTRDEFQTLQEELFQIRANDDDSVISALRMELSSIEKAKSLLIQENNVLTDKIHSLEMEFVKTRNMHAQELSSTSDAAKELANAKKTISVFKETNSNLQEKVEILEKQLESSNNRVMTLKDCLKTENDTVRKLEAELSTFKGKVFLMENELRNLSAEATQERDAVTTLKEQMTHLESALASEKRAFAEKDKKNSTLSSQIEALQKDKTFLEGKIEIVMNQYESTVSESQAKINVVNKNYKDLQSRYESLSDRATHLEEIKTTMTRLVLELESAIKKETEEKMRLEQLLDEAHHKIESLETHSSFKLPLSPSKRGSLIRKMDSDEVLSRVSDSSDRPSILNLSRTTQKTHRLSFKNFFKSSNAIGDMLRHSLPRLDVDDDSSQTHERSFSIDTCNKSQLSLRKLSDIISSYRSS